MKILHSFVWVQTLVLAASVTLAGAANGISSYQDLPNPSRHYVFVAWPKGKGEPIRFKSALYTKNSVSEVRIDEGELFPALDETPVRRTTDFDSVKIYSLAPVRSVSTPQGLAYFRDTVWNPASVVGNLWVFKKIEGQVSLYTLEPGRGAYRGLDTGAGLAHYDELAVRHKIRQNPRSAKLLREEKIGHTVAWVMGWGGAGLLATGAVTSLISEDGPGGTLMLTGIGVAVFAWLPHIMVQDRYESAIKAYNEDQAK